MAVIDRRRVRQTKLSTVIVHRRAGNRKVRSKYDAPKGPGGHWAVLCGRYTTFGLNTTTDVSQVTCMHCLKRMGE